MSKPDKFGVKIKTPKDFTEKKQIEPYKKSFEGLAKDVHTPSTEKLKEILDGLVKEQGQDYVVALPYKISDADGREREVNLTRLGFAFTNKTFLKNFSSKLRILEENPLPNLDCVVEESEKEGYKMTLFGALIRSFDEYMISEFISIKNRRPTSRLSLDSDVVEFSNKSTLKALGAAVYFSSETINALRAMGSLMRDLTAQGYLGEIDDFCGSFCDRDGRKEVEMTACGIAIYRGNLSLIEYSQRLDLRKPDSIAVKYQDGRTRTMLGMAVDKDDMKIIEFLSRNGVSLLKSAADIDSENPRTAIQLAYDSGKMEVVKYLMELGVNIGQIKPEKTEEKKREGGLSFSELHKSYVEKIGLVTSYVRSIAASIESTPQKRMEYQEKIIELIKKSLTLEGSNFSPAVVLNSSLDKEGNNVVHLAIHYGLFDVAKFLLEQNGVNIKCQNASGRSTFDMIKEKSGDPKFDKKESFLGKLLTTKKSETTPLDLQKLAAKLALIEDGEEHEEQETKNIKKEYVKSKNDDMARSLLDNEQQSLPSDQKLPKKTPTPTEARKAGQGITTGYQTTPS